jgi:hypothetical protein
MNLVIPPLFFYAIGAVLVISGVARTLTLGRRRPDRDIQADDGDDPSVAASAAHRAAKAAQVRRRHMIFGVVWVLLGLFLILSTAGVLKARSSL